MKRKLIEIKRESLIECDTKDCDYKIPYSESLEKKMASFINAGCPKCGKNLLTKEDFLLNERLIKTIAWLNKWFSWITFFYSKKAEYKEGSLKVHVHKGIDFIEDNPKKHSN